MFALIAYLQIRNQPLPTDASPATLGKKPEAVSKSYLRQESPRTPKSSDSNRAIYFRNKLEFSLEGGWLPINVPFPLDVFVGDVYNTYPLKYTLVPIIGSLRWHLNTVGGPWILRGNWDLTISGSVTAIPRGTRDPVFRLSHGNSAQFCTAQLENCALF